MDRYHASAALEQTRTSIRQCLRFVAENLPMFSDSSVDLSGMVRVSSLKIGMEHVIGNPMPVLEHLEIEVRPYSTFGQPHWVDQAVIQLQRMLTLKIQFEIEQRRMDVLGAAVKKITRRVNLFEKVLIPKTEMNIKRIRIFLSDSERSAVVRAKMTKKKRLQKSSQWPS